MASNGMRWHTTARADTRMVQLQSEMKWIVVADLPDYGVRVPEGSHSRENHDGQDREGRPTVPGSSTGMPCPRLRYAFHASVP